MRVKSCPSKVMKMNKCFDKLDDKRMYIFHPYHLAEQMDNETRVCIALLHDVVEDTDITIEQLRAEFSPEVTDALELLTHDENVDYYDYRH